MTESTSPAASGRRTKWLLFALAAAAYAYFDAGLQWNPTSRLGLLLALVDHGELHIDRYQRISYLATGDLSEANGRFYSDKAIGTSVVGALPYALARPALALVADGRVRAALTCWWVRVTTIALPAAFCIVLLFQLARRVSEDDRTALFPALAIAFGTPVWSFATAFFGHVAGAVWLFVAFLVIRNAREAVRPPQPRTAFALGLVLGLAVLTEYPLALPALVLAAYGSIVATERAVPDRRRLFAAAILGGTIPLALLGAYNVACFGSPWTVGYQRHVSDTFAAVHAHGLVGVGLPSFESLVYVTVHPVRGLFAHAPVLLLAFPGLVAMARRREWRLEAAVVATCFVLLLAVNAGFGWWWAGWTAHARHVIPALLLLGVPLAFVPRPWRALGTVLLAISVVQTFAVVATTPVTPSEPLETFMATRAPTEWVPLLRFSPIYAFSLPRLLGGEVGWNPFRLAGVDGHLSLAPFAVVCGALVVAIVRSATTQPAGTPAGADARWSASA